MGVPFMPTYTTLGSDLLKRNGNLREFSSPVNEERLVAVRALRPDVAILHVQRADTAGNVHLWGNLGVAIDGARASRKVIVVAEEIVAPEVIASDPNRTLIPGFLVTAIVHEPCGAHPSPVQGYYGRDHAFFHEYHDQTRELDGFERWIKHWVAEVSSRDSYLKRLGESRAHGLRVREHALSVPVDFGF
jgi:glutaconate CoA-transferase subunit A